MPMELIIYYQFYGQATELDYISMNQAFNPTLWSKQTGSLNWSCFLFREHNLINKP